MKSERPHLIMISAMYENGGNTMHRSLDGHSRLASYPFESQLGARLTSDFMESMFPFKYRWPEFPLASTPDRDFELFFDEEMKTRVRNPKGSKFRDADLQVEESERKRIFLEIMEGQPRTRGALVMAFYEATFRSWKNFYGNVDELKAYVGYSPIIGVDADKILTDLPDAHVLHVVRNPYSAYAETCRRPFPLSLENYTMLWNWVQYLAQIFAVRFPERFHIVRYEDFVADRETTMKSLSTRLGIEFEATLLKPSWNGVQLGEVYPWGTIREPSPATNRATAENLSAEQWDSIRALSLANLKSLNYQDWKKEG
jgi:hypothetical protein